MSIDPDDAGETIFEGDCRECGKYLYRPFPVEDARDKNVCRVFCSKCRTTNKLEKRQT